MEKEITPKMLSSALMLGLKIEDLGQFPSDDETTLAIEILEQKLSEETLAKLTIMAHALEKQREIRVYELNLDRMKKELNL